MFTGLEADRRGIHQPANPGKSREYFFELKCFFLTCGMDGLVECLYLCKSDSASSDESIFWNQLISVGTLEYERAEESFLLNHANKQSSGKQGRVQSTTYDLELGGRG